MYYLEEFPKGCSESGGLILRSGGLTQLELYVSLREHDANPMMLDRTHLAALSHLVKLVTEKGEAVCACLKDISVVVAAGYIREYLVAHFYNAHWLLPLKEPLRMAEYLAWEEDKLETVDVACWGSFLRNEAGDVLTARPLVVSNIAQYKAVMELSNRGAETDWTDEELQLLRSVVQAWPPAAAEPASRPLSCSREHYLKYLEETAHLGGPRPFPHWVSPEYSLAQILLVGVDFDNGRYCDALASVETMSPSVTGDGPFAELRAECGFETPTAELLAVADTKRAGPGFGQAEPGALVPIVKKTDKCPTEREDLDLDMCADVPETYGRSPARPLEWGEAATNDRLLYGRLGCGDGTAAIVERIAGGAMSPPPEYVPGTPSVITKRRSPPPKILIDKWKVRCPGQSEEILYTSAYHCGSKCPPRGYQILPHTD